MLLAKPCHAHFSLKAVASAARPRGVALRGHFFGFAFFTADFLAPLFALLFEIPAAPSPALRPLPMGALRPTGAARFLADKVGEVRATRQQSSC